ncbi:MAG: NUDIX domain-containing protein [Drouetiella hepatica Uher 2000/2452]|jgi:ADP-ribose pyrophosphatase YjhB (NUDIX family)|uniref:NUDIX domain-containing protein n=1 Tax=Drouetiella hepatica Uher 2000/2452 TaxID=904376 RepID=A0A951UP34_9CYAN|nr:NUDIX domain-containing protein [Drouetiella hepatica Uher 2000/2452]
MQPDSKSDFKLRVSVLGLILDAGDVLLIHQTSLPEADLWDLPGGGLEPWESLMEGLTREVREETGLIDFQVEGVLTIAETFFPKETGKTSHLLNLIYRCSVPDRSAVLSSEEPEVGERGIQWLAIGELTAETCTTRTWKALLAAGLVDP